MNFSSQQKPKNEQAWISQLFAAKIDVKENANEYFKSTRIKSLLQNSGCSPVNVSPIDYQVKLNYLSNNEPQPKNIDLIHQSTKRSLYYHIQNANPVSPAEYSPILQNDNYKNIIINTRERETMFSNLNPLTKEISFYLPKTNIQTCCTKHDKTQRFPKQKGYQIYVGPGTYKPKFKYIK